MNAPVTIVAVDEFDVATNAINSWRGCCLHSFTRAEVVVTETLAVLAQNTSSALVQRGTGGALERAARNLAQRGATMRDAATDVAQTAAGRIQAGVTNAIETRRRDLLQAEEAIRGIWLKRAWRSALLNSLSQ